MFNNWLRENFQHDLSLYNFPASETTNRKAVKYYQLMIKLIYRLMNTIMAQLVFS